MSRSPILRRSGLAAVVTAIHLGILGCGGHSSPDTPLPPMKAHMQALNVFYGSFTGEHRGRPPQNEAEFRAYVKAMPPQRLTVMKVENVDELFVSPRDSQPLVINYNLPLSLPGAPGAGALMYEQTGSDGTRYVLLGNGTIEEMDEARFAELPGKK